MRIQRACLLFSLCLLSSCAQRYAGYGGGTVGTGLPDASYGKSADSLSRVAIAVSGTLSDEDGRPISGAELEIETERSSRWVRTDSEGRFQFRMPLAEGEEVFLSLARGKMSESLRFVFHGLKELHLVRDRDGKLHGVGL